MLHYGLRLESYASRHAVMQGEVDAMAGAASPARSEDDISVGCPSPPRPEDYFEPLKKLKMVPPDMDGGTEDEAARSGDDETSRQFDGVKSFSILDILSHRPRATPAPEARPIAVPPVRIVRPWDLHARGAHLERLQQQLELAQHYDIGEHIRAQIQLTEQLKAREYELSEHFKAQSLSAFEHRLGLSLTARDFELHHQQISDHIKAQQYALLRQKAALESQHLLRSKSVDLCSYTGASETGSERSSSVTSDCCSPDIVGAGSSRHSGQGSQAKSSKGAGSTPLDALFQMTSKTFEANSTENGSDGQSNHLNLFNSRPQPKKKRKSRTAFTNHQIFELEKRFLYQKYLSPADRDEIAASLGLSNAQVITWFQNRRAKLKRDMEELKKDVESAKVLSAHKSFLENVQDLGILKKKAISMGASEEAATNLIVSAQK